MHTLDSRQSSTVLRGAALMAAVAALLLASCASKPPEVAPQVTSQLVPVRTEAARLRDLVARTAGNAKTLAQTSSSDITPQLDVLSGNLADLKSALRRGQAAVRTADVQTGEYFANWDRQLQTMSQDMQKTGERRQAEAQASYGSLRGTITDTRDQLTSFVNSLSEAEQYLRTDRTAAGVKAVSPKLMDSVDRAPRIQSDLDEVIAQIDAMQGKGQ
jgi:hypothetical protein